LNYLYQPATMTPHAGMYNSACGYLVYLLLNILQRFSALTGHFLRSLAKVVAIQSCQCSQRTTKTLCIPWKKC